MTTLLDLCKDRLRERHDAQAALESKSEVLRVRLAQEHREVIRLIERDVLMGTELPAGATISMRNSSTHGHQVAVRFPGNLSIDAEHLYVMGDDRLIVPGFKFEQQRWIARHHPIGKQKTFDDFIDAVIWLLDIEMKDEPPQRPSKRLVRPQPLALATLIGRTVKDVGHVGPTACIVTQDRLVLDIESDANLDITVRCVCGSPLAVGDGGDVPPMYCAICGKGWDTIKEFLAWKQAQLGHVPPKRPTESAMHELLRVTESLCLAQRSSNVAQPLWDALTRFRCTCGEFPVEGPVDGHWMLRCCGNEWDSWEGVVDWKEAQDAETQDA